MVVALAAMMGSASAADADEPLLEALRAKLQSEPIAVGMLLAVGATLEPEPEAGEHNGFSIGQARFRVYGRLDRGFDYFLQANFVNSPALLDGRLGWTAAEWFGVDGGLYRVPFSAELQIPAQSTDFGSRSRVVTLLSPGRQIGVQGRGQVGPLHYAGGVFNGSGPGGNLNDDDRVMPMARLEATAESAGGPRVVFGLSAAQSHDAAAPWAGNPAFAGRRVLGGADWRMTAGPILFTGEGLVAVVNPDVGPDVTMYGGYLTFGISPLDEHQFLARLDSLSLDGDPLDHEVWLGWNWFVTEPFEVQVSWIVPLNRGFGDQQLGLGAQVNF